MIKKIKDFVLEKKTSKENGEKIITPEGRSSKLKINWIQPDLAEEVQHYDDKAKIEFYQHNITIGNKDIGKVSPRSTKFYKYLLDPFKKGSFEHLPSFSDFDFQVSKIQNLSAFEFDNIVSGAYGKSYGEVLEKMTEDLKKKGSLDLPAPVIIRFINFGETRTSSESSYYLFSGSRRINLALHYAIPIKAWVVDLVPSRRDVRDFAQKSGATKNPEKLKKILRRLTGKESLDDLNARERFKIIQSLKSF
jgi:hypothetical protein